MVNIKEQLAATLGEASLHSVPREALLGALRAALPDLSDAVAQKINAGLIAATQISALSQRGIPFERYTDVILDAFRHENDLSRCLLLFMAPSVQLDEVVRPGNLRQRATELCRQLDEEGRLDEFVCAMREDNKTNSTLLNFARELGLET